MDANKTARDPLPERFKTAEEFEEFWNTHSLADYDDIQRDVHFDIQLEPDEMVPVHPDIARELRERARRRKILFVELVNRMLEEKLGEAA